MSKLTITLTITLLLFSTSPAGGKSNLLDPKAKLIRHKDFSYILYTPKNLPPDAKHPLMVVLHQSGGNATSLFPSWKAAADQYGYVLAFPNARRSKAWTHRDAKNIMNMIDEIRGRIQIDPERINASGFSLGAIFTYHLLQMRPDLFAAIAPYAGLMKAKDRVLYRKLKPGFTKTKVCMLHGSRDTNIYIRESASARAYLKNLGVPLEFKVFPVGHWFPDWLPEEIIRCVENYPENRS